jgi:hypothetical protein
MPEEISHYHWGSQGASPPFAPGKIELTHRIHSSCPPDPLLLHHILLLLPWRFLASLCIENIHSKSLGRGPEEQASVHLGIRGDDHLVLGFYYVERGEEGHAHEAG